MVARHAIEPPRVVRLLHELLDVDDSGDAEPARAVRRLEIFLEAELLLQHLAPAERVDHPARPEHLLLAVFRAHQDLVVRAAASEVDANHVGRLEHADAVRFVERAQVVLQPPAVELILGDLRVEAGTTDLGALLEARLRGREEEAEAELVELSLMEIVAEAEHVAEVLASGIDGRFAHLERRDRKRSLELLHQRDRKIRVLCFELAREAEPREAAAADDDVELV
jgi:hypothetical protein